MKKILSIALFCATTLFAGYDEIYKLVQEVEIISDTSFKFKTDLGWKTVKPSDNMGYKQVDMNYTLILTAISNGNKIHLNKAADNVVTKLILLPAPSAN